MKKAVGVKQKVTLYPNGDTKTYTEYHNDIEVMHSEYDERRNQVFFRDHTGYWMKRRFEKTAHDNTGKVIFFLDKHMEDTEKPITFTIPYIQPR